MISEGDPAEPMMGGVFSGPEIITAREAGDIVIEPFDLSRVQNSSVDVSLGEWFYTTHEPLSGLINPYDGVSIANYFGEALRAITHEEWCDKRGRKPLPNIPLDRQVIVLQPGERILAHTIEFIGARRNGTTMMHAKSTMGRLGISVCYDAGWGDTGYFTRWTMEVKNNNHHAEYPLVVGEPVAQIIFFKMAAGGNDYAQSGHYQSTSNVSELIRDWTPDKMLPRMFKLWEN